MSKNFFEAELRFALRRQVGFERVREIGDSTPFFTHLAQAFPATGSKIDWGRVPGSITNCEDQPVLQAARFGEFLDEVTRSFGLSGDVIYMGDSAIDIALSGPLDQMRKILPTLIGIPQHHYLVAAEFSWCVSFTMEGDMAFGFRPPRQAWST